MHSLSERTPVIINWEISSFFGWGVYGLNLALNWASDFRLDPVCSFPISSQNIVVDPLRQRRLEKFFQNSNTLADHLILRQNQCIRISAPVLLGVGNEFRTDVGPFGTNLTGNPTIGVAFFETANLSDEALERARSLDLVVAGSSWGESILSALGLTRVTTLLQGVDHTLFHPAGRLGLFADRFLVFSGGKLELRKGQDLVITAFSRFARKYRDALLVTAWHSPWPQLARSLDATGKAAPLVINGFGQLDLYAWATANGILADQFLDLGAVPNAPLPSVLREMDVALFPNRCEGGTNLVAMECMACGVPAILSANTGHLDLIDHTACFVLEQQDPIAGQGAGVGGIAGWGESSVGEIVDVLERAYHHRKEARERGRRAAELMQRMTWKRTADTLRDLVFSVA
jgi:glycosyltransferase involved in cell wall biosynthesis